MEKFVCPATRVETPEEAEIMERNGRAVIYCAKVAKQRAERDSKRNKVVRIMLAFSIVFVAVAVLLRALVPPCLM